ncbi:MAG: transposase [Lentisphaerae bacterium]|nr:transposase [Lentisphaerota bacterium]
MRTARIVGRGASYYHCMTRVIERRMLLNRDEKERFRKTMRQVAAFAGIEVLTYAVLDNHNHILLQVPERVELTEAEVLERITGLYGRVRASAVAMELDCHREQGRHEEAAALLYSYTHRMYDLSQYMKMIMQRFTQSYNRRHARRGTLWEDRFKSILVEGTADALSTMAAYIDLNAVRAGIVEDPKAYRFCGYGEAVAGNKDARHGIEHIAAVLGQSGNWSALSQAYRKYLFMQAGTHTKRGRTLREAQIEKVLDAGGKLSKAELLHCRVRYFSDGVVLGSKAFVEDIFESHREEFGLKRKTGARKPKYGHWGELCTMRDLRLDPVTLPVAA